MRVTWILSSLIILLIGMIFSSTIVGALIGIPLIILSLIILFIGILLPDKRKVVYIHRYKRR